MTPSTPTPIPLALLAALLVAGPACVDSDATPSTSSSADKEDTGTSGETDAPETSAGPGEDSDGTEGDDESGAKVPDDTSAGTTGDGSSGDGSTSAAGDTGGTGDTGSGDGTGDTGGSDDTSDTDGSGSTGGFSDGCACIVHQDPGFGFEEPELPICGVQLCPTATATESDSGFTLNNPDTLECMIAALHDRTPGVLRWYVSENGGQYTSEGYFLIQEDGSGVRRRWGWADQAFDVYDARFGPMLAPEHYEACAAEPDPEARFWCATGGLTDILAICDEGWEWEEFC